MLIRHSFLYVAGRLVPGLMSMATTASLTRLLDPGRYGLFGLALAIMTFGSNMAFDWLGVSFMRFYQSRRDSPQVIGTFVRLFGLLVALTGAATAIAVLCGAVAGSGASIYVIGVAMIWSNSWFELCARIEVANFRPMRYLLMNLGRALGSMAGAAGGAWLTRDPVWAAAGMSLGTGASAFLCDRRVWRMAFAGFDRDLARAVLVFGVPLAAGMALSSVVNGGTRSMVEALAGHEALGFYTAAFMLVQNTLAVTAAGIASAGYSLAVRAVEAGDAELARTQLRANGTLLLAVLAPAALGLSLTAHGVAVTMVGGRYVAAVTELTPWLALGSFFAAFRSNHLDQAFQLGKRPSLQIWVSALSATITVGLCWALIPRYGPLGAAAASAASAIASSIAAVVLGRHAYQVPLPLDAAARITAACAVMALIILALPGAKPSAFFVQVGAGGIAYLAAATALDLLGARRWIVRVAMRRRTWPTQSV